MRATVDIDSELLVQAKDFAFREQRAFQSLVAEGLRLILRSKVEKKNLNI